MPNFDLKQEGVEILGTFGDDSKVDKKPPKGSLRRPKKAVKAFPDSDADWPMDDGRTALQKEIDAYYQPSSNVGKRCHHSHPPLPITVDGTTYTLTGGTGNSKPKSNVDIFIGFDHGMVKTDRRFPWTEGWEIHFPILDMGIPPVAKDFKDLIAWLEEKILEGYKVHMGCIGGHGRTGLVMSALVTQMTGEKDSIAYVRKHYCKKAVESAEQVTWLKKHFGIKPQKPTKDFGSSKAGGYTGSKVWGAVKTFPKEGSSTKAAPVVSCVPVEHSVHGDNQVLASKKPRV